MFHRNRWVNWIASICFVLGASACTDLGAGCGCGIQPLPEGGLPADQILEGGAQVRVTPAGFEKLKSVVPPVLNDVLGPNAFCIGEQDVLGLVDICSTTDGGACPSKGCGIDINLDKIDMTVPDGDTFRIDVQFDVGADVHADAGWVGSCVFTAGLDNAHAVADIGFGIDPATGELTIELQDLGDVDLTGINLSGTGTICGTIAGLADGLLGAIAGILDTFIGDLLLDLLRPVLDDLIQGFLPDPLGIEGMIDVGSLLAGISPGTQATVEFKGVPGGYVNLAGGGLSIGLITGINADEDLRTRTPDLDSEPAFCVPPVPAPDFAAAPASLAQTGRGTFTLLPAEEFLGAPDPAAEVAIGLAETTLDLGGHHAFTSGALCLGIGASLVEQLNLGTFGLIVPSLSELGGPKDPLLLVTRPQSPPDFRIGAGTEDDPSLTVSLKNFEIDFYAFIFERYVRAFSLGLTLDVGVNLEFTTDATGKPAIMPILVGLSGDNITLHVSNEEFLREDRDTLQGLLPSLLDIVIPLLTDGLGEFALPDFAGFTLTNLRVAKVQTSEDDFLAILASLGASSSLAAMAEKYPSLNQVVDELSEVAPARVTTRARLVSVDTPSPELVRSALLGRRGSLPTITLDVPATDELGRPLEYTWNIGGGINRPFRSGSPLVISDRAFAYQGKYDIEVRARAVGDYRTIDLEPRIIGVIIDSVPPAIDVPGSRVVDGTLQAQVSDLVTGPEALEVAFGRVGDDRPWTSWQRGTTVLAAADLESIAVDGMVTVWARDEAGNVSSADVPVGPTVGFHGTAGEGGCNCSASPDGRSLAGMALLLALTVLLLAGPRRLAQRARMLERRSPRIGRHLGVLALWAGLSVGLSTVPGCSCGDAAAMPACEIDDDCADLCPANNIALCFDGECVCIADVPYGNAGQYSDISLDSAGAAWISAYNSTHGDLVAARWQRDGRVDRDAWEFVDGVPDGPVVLEQSTIRGGIFAEGPDTGKYTSVAVAPDDTPLIAYFDADTASLKMTGKYGGVWQHHIVDEGSIGGDPELGYRVVGQYTSITINAANGHPGIAYFAQVSEGGGAVRTEVRFASAQTPTPSSAADWIIYEVDSASVSEDDGDPLTVPYGIGLFVTSARQSDGTPVVAYYDRINGDLMVSRFDLMNGTFDAPEAIDGAGVDVGWYPSLVVDGDDTLHLSYVSATRDDLLYVNSLDRTPEVVDDGYRIVGTTEDGHPKPEFHLVGDDSSLQLTGAGPVVTYQDATSHALMLATKNASDEWEYLPLAGDEEPFAGGYGFYAASAYDGDQVVISSWVIDQPQNDTWVEVFRRNIGVE